MINIIVKKGYDLNIAGRPMLEMDKLEKPEKVAVLPEHIPFIIPRLKVETGQHVKIGTPLFEDKRDTRLVFLSPGAGVIERITYGKRRVIREIVIHLDKDETSESFEPIGSEKLESMDGQDLTERLVQGGMWPFLKGLPFRDIADRQKPPSSIIVALNSKDSFLPSPQVYLSGKEDLFMYGLSMLKRLSKTVHVMVAHGDVLPPWVEKNITHTVKGPYPCDDPGVLLFHIKTSQAENNAYYINGQDLILMAGFLRDGRFPTHRVIALGGSKARVKTHVLARIGLPIKDLVKGGDDSFRVVAGGVLRGYRISTDSYLGFFESSLTLLAKGDEEDFFGFLRPGFKRPSYSRTFLSVLNPSALPMDCGMHGEERPCVNCGTCASVCPVDILPQFTFKCIQVGEVEESLAHGLLDCVECGLCTYVCPSKIDVTMKLKTAKAEYYKERA